MEILNEYKKFIGPAVVFFLVVVSLLFVVRLLSEFRDYGVGSKDANTITLSGYGEVQAVPDIATVYFTISKDAKTVKEAQEMVAQVETKALDVLKENKVEDKDIKTQNASVYPKYEWRSSSSVDCAINYCPPQGGKNVIVGYTASESITVKVRNIDDAGKIMQGLGNAGVSDLNGPNFAIDDEDALQVEARKEAIKDAKEKAEILAKDLGVRLGRVVSFNEDGYYPVSPMYSTKSYDAGMMEMRAELPKGENTVSSRVNITYEIK